MEWIAYCTTCNREIDSAPNGEIMELTARFHGANPDKCPPTGLEPAEMGEYYKDLEHGPHKVLVGYEID